MVSCLIIYHGYQATNHHATLTQTMRDPCMDRYGHLEIHCNPLSKMWSDHPPHLQRSAWCIKYCYNVQLSRHFPWWSFLDIVIFTWTESPNYLLPHGSLGPTDHDPGTHESLWVPEHWEWVIGSHHWIDVFISVAVNYRYSRYKSIWIFRSIIDMDLSISIYRVSNLTWAIMS